MAVSRRRIRDTRSRRPIMRLLDLLGRRWALRILWELRGEALNFRALQAACGGLSPSVLNRRLAELREARWVESAAEGYRLTPLGRELLERFGPLLDWAQRWAES
jgi:DNA-binding HxlR family transcriptional regulator